MTTSAEEARARIEQRTRESMENERKLQEAIAEAKRLTEEMDKATKDAFPPIDWRKHD